ncbi:MAG: hypothetical protein KY457_02855 [Actinobacteria bacterium]|nr:hypothetical protein [Actinomycetota bacterium]
MTTVVLRLLVAAWILVMLARASRAAWRHRRLTLLVWRRIRWRHVLGALGLLAVVGTLVTTLLVHVPGMSVGLGSLVGSSGNAVFIPLEEAVSRTGPVPGAGPDWALLLLSTAFFGGLVALFPWLAFIEEEVFRAGLEDASWPRELGTALVFGLAHLVMLVPVGAALAIAVAGFVYGRVYRAAYARTDGRGAPDVAVAAYRPTRRAQAAAARERARVIDEPASRTVELVAPSPTRRQAEAVVAATVWHATFNTTVVGMVWLAIVLSALA